MEVVADTTVLIDLFRHRRRPESLAGLRRALGESAVLLPWIVQAEYARGAYYQGIGREELEQYFQAYTPLPMSADVIHLYAQTWAEMRRRKLQIDYPDLWIAVAALLRGVPVITRNTAHFEKVPGLEVVGYKI
ncbi:MAG: type II toxin-antitoxin system VapC family toxin [Verrucomicrobia subdivision 3 bacterium]|nr:type II toxin-antitoxin system VapC family toxin [Limisphaerales bacterium]